MTLRNKNKLLSEDSCPDMERPLFILGAGGHASEVLGIAEALCLPIKGFVDTTLDHKKQKCDRVVVNSLEPKVEYICGVGSPKAKLFFLSQDIELFNALVHPSCETYLSVKLERGITIGANTTLTTEIEIGRATSINSNCCISHNCLIGACCHISSNSSLGGGVTICDEVYIGMNAVILPGVKVGKGAIIGAGATVTKNVDPWTIVAGNPARVLRNRQGHDSFRM